MFYIQNGLIGNDIDGANLGFELESNEMRNVN